MTQSYGRRLVAAALFFFAGAFAARPAETPASYIVVLQAPSTAAALRAEAVAGVKPDPQRVKRASSTAAEAQALARAVLAAQGVEVVGSVQHLLNAVFVRATREQARAMKRLGGVDRVLRARRFEPLLDSGSAIVRATQAVQALGGDGRAGEGLRIGVIDSGVDHEHPAFADPALPMPPGFPKGRPGDLAFTNNKVIVARSYAHLLSSLDAAQSRPDDFSPRDRIGHGTAVAAIAAGRPVQSVIGRLVGVAPRAYIGNYKIFGSPDINPFTNDFAILAALDDAAIDGMDILTVSFGAVAQLPWDEPCGDGALCDPVAQAAQEAVEAFGMVVVAAAGNAGARGEQAFPTKNSISSPATAPGVIAVAATTNSRQLQQSIVYGGRRAPALSGVGPELLSPLTADARDAVRFGDSRACAPFASRVFDGAIAVIDRGGCEPEFKVDHAARAGAVAVVMINSEGRDDPEVLLGLETTDIPTYTIGHGEGRRLVEFLERAVSPRVTLDSGLRPVAFASDQVAPFSSRGPGVGGLLKPDIAAPGTFIYTAAQRFDPNGDVYSQTGFEQVDGTSFAAPFVAGAAALVWQANPAFTAAQVKSALVNTAELAVIENGREASVTAVGGGLLDARAALEPIATVEPATLGFGDLRGRTLPLERTIVVANPARNTATYRLTVVERTGNNLARLRVEGAATASVQIRGGERASLRVSLSGSRPAAGEYEGFLRVSRDGGGRDLLVPFYYAVGDSVPHNAFVLAGTGVVGTVDEPHPELLIFKVVDRHGQPVPDLNVAWSVLDGGGWIVQADPSTDAYGIAAADVDMGPDPGFQDFLARAGSLEVEFLNEARLKPFVGGMVNGAGFTARRPVAPGSIVSIFGDGLAEFTGSARALPLPVALKHVSVSFDFPEDGLSLPGRLFYVSPGQLNVQVPWEFAGRNFVFVKVRIGDSFSRVATLNLADSAPGVFDYEAGGRRFAIATRPDGRLAGPSSPAARGDTIVVYGTGFGPLDVAQTTGQPAGSRLARVRGSFRATVGGREAAVHFAGLTPGFVGLYQANVTLPADLPAGDHELRLISNGVAGNSTLISVR